MPNKCLVPGCGASYRKNKSLNFFSFVRNEERRKIWIEKIAEATGKRLDDLSIDVVSQLELCLIDGCNIKRLISE